MRVFWTEKEIDILKKEYPISTKKNLLKILPTRSWDSIKSKAKNLKIKRYQRDNRLSNLDILLDETNETYYWIGFIMADGHVTENRIVIDLNNQDTKHLQKFKRFIKCKNKLKNYKKNHISIHLTDSKYVSKLRKKFDIKNNKTYNPCTITNIKDDDLFLSLLTGFIDGDGSIRNLHNRKDFNLSVKCHNSWDKNLKYMLDFIYRITNEKCNTSIKYTKDNFPYFIISNTVVLKKLKKRILKLNIPYMERKWDIIDLNFINKYEKATSNRKQMIKEISINPTISASELGNKLNLSVSSIYKYKKALQIK